MSRLPQRWPSFHMRVMIAAVVIALALVTAIRAEYEVDVKTSLRCSFCGRVGPSTGHMLVLADERIDIPWGPSAKRWGACDQCWPRVKRQVTETLERLKCETQKGEKP